MAPKRKVQSLGLNRRVRPRREDWELEPESDNQQSDDEVSEEDIRDQDSDGQDQSDVDEDDESEVRKTDESPQTPYS